jgi:predicted transcriptional regulator of viral defense system
MLADHSASEKHILAAAVKLVPNGIVCLHSALRFHRLTEVGPTEVWLALDRKAWGPRIKEPPVRLVRFSGRALVEGIESHMIDGVTVRVTSAARTVADCFKYRNKMGLEVALEALRAGWRKKRFTIDELWDAGDVCRVTRVMGPYLEGVVR